MAWERFLVGLSIFLSPLEFILQTESIVEQCAKSLSAFLPTTLATGFVETEPELEPLKVPWFINWRCEVQSLTKFLGL